MAALAPTLFDHDLASLPLPEGEPAFRRRQVANWLYRRGVTDAAQMTDLPAPLRAWLAAEQAAMPFVASRRFPSDDGSVRYLFTLRDGKQTEAVYMPYAGRRTVCLSSMVGCPAGCAFCATGALGFGRNLTRGEIVGQLVEVARQEGLEPTEVRNVVLMGMGEALLNYDNAIGAIRTFIDPDGLDMSPRRITLSTVGLPSRMRKLASEGLPLVLAVSLHAPDQETRQRIIPTALANSVTDIVAAMHDWQRATSRRVTIEYTMLEGVNDHPWQADMLAELLVGLTSHVNLIPFNPWTGSGFSGTQRPRLAQFQRRLEARGVGVSVRFSRGRDAGAACGQLALQGAEAASVADSGPVLSMADPGLAASDA
ncbi:MAG TPA: 23S rRNA (adenine(2503)-C(2))-methyltransferase RlmN [Trueperaceae bacterium]|jgi:23S rRNA (adenine2503-C2)-methyltransferase|nr:23S rRNA (adenine(2503)-C(2))-methyltransferase RlmN [Trueperaceae bacterium]